mmetsp:Transcript_46989/g.34397  ORF Transcript_46989/g.34397 Transcript_46989/m.34397 type:complete len:107 (+) Transcript_46989:1593-1913(+)
MNVEKVEPKDDIPSFIKPSMRTTPNLGPGSYMQESSKLQQALSQVYTNIPAPPHKDNLSFGKDPRFKDKDTGLPGPGQYAGVDGWNKKTFNLKFLKIGEEGLKQSQ